MSIVRVLVVDDSVTIRAMMRQVLESDPEIRVAALAANADEAEAVLEGSLADVVTLDVEMPGLNGLDYLKQLKANHGTPVVMLSSHTAPGKDIRAEALLAGADGCFNKADAVREKDKLIKLVKAAAHHKARIAKEDAAAVEAYKCTH